MSETVWTYLGVKPCGCAVAIMVDRPEYAKDTAKDIAKWIRDGWAVERVEIEQGRNRLHSCIHKEVK